MPDLGLNVLLKGKNMARLLGGLWVALRISLLSVAISIPLGILLGVLMSGKNPVVKAILRVYLEIIRIMPQMVLLFLVFFGTTRAWGWDLSGETASVIVFVLWGTAEMSDLVRGALISIPKHQYESSEALGLTKAQTYWYIIIPQTVRRLIPLSINLITRMIKTTSLVLMIGVVEEKAAGMTVRPEDKEFIANFYKYAFVGLTLEWVRTGMKDDPAALIERVSTLSSGILQRLWRRAGSISNSPASCRLNNSATIYTICPL